MSIELRALSYKRCLSLSKSWFCTSTCSVTKAQGSQLITKKAPLGATDNRQVWSTQCGMPVKKSFKKNQSAVGTTETSLSCLQHFLYHHGHECRGFVLRTPPPAYILSSLCDSELRILTQTYRLSNLVTLCLCVSVTFLILN